MKTRRTIVLTALMALVVGACRHGRIAVAERAGIRGRDRDRGGIGVRVGRGLGLRVGRARPRSPAIRRKRSSRAWSRRATIGSGRSTCRPRSTSTSRTRSPASRRPIRASRSRGTTTRARSRMTSTTRSPRATRRTSSTCRSARAGSASTRGKGLLLGLDTPVPKAVKDIYFPDLWKQQLIDGVNYQFPWYQGLNVELLNKAHLREGRRRPSPPSPRPSTASRPCARRSSTRRATAVRHPPDRQRPARPDGLRGQRQGLQRRRQAFAFNSPEGVAWLQMYVDMVNAGTLDPTVLTAR